MRDIFSRFRNSNLTVCAQRQYCFESWEISLRFEVPLLVDRASDLTKRCLLPTYAYDLIQTIHINGTVCFSKVGNFHESYVSVKTEYILTVLVMYLFALKSNLEQKLWDHRSLIRRDKYNKHIRKFYEKRSCLCRFLQASSSILHSFSALSNIYQTNKSLLGQIRIYLWYLCLLV